jgi:flagellar protein FlaG
MELDAVVSNGYQGSNTKVSIKPIQSTINDTTEGVNIELVSVKSEDKSNPVAEDSSKNKNLINAKNNDMKKSISEINSKLNKNTEAIFGIHEETNRVTIKIVDKDTKEVIKEIPPEKTLEMIAKIWEFAGILIDEKL